MESLLKQAIVIGAGIGGLAVAIRLRVKGYAVTVIEAADRPGGKLAEIRMEGYRFDAGPSLFTLPEQVDELFRIAGKTPSDYFRYESLPIITRYFYPDGTLINAWQDAERFAEEIEVKTGEPRAHVKTLLRKSRQIYGITREVFLERSLHTLSTYLRWNTLKSALQVHRIDAFRTMDQANRSFFKDARVVQLFNRYATYNGSDPWQAPATLNIIPHLEHNLGAYFPENGMYDITLSLFTLAKEIGVVFQMGTVAERIVVGTGSRIAVAARPAYGEPVEAPQNRGQEVKGVQVNGKLIPADLVVSNADIVPTYRKLMPDQPAPESTLRQPRSSSALIFYWAMDRQYPQTDVHNIFFSANYQEEFQKMWREKSLSDDPTVYLYVSARRNPQDAPSGCDNFFVMINAPCDQGQDWDALIAEARKNILRKLEQQMGTPVEAHIRHEQVLDPRTIASRTSSHQGALYGNSSNNRFAAFLRHPNFSSRIKGLYFTGGSVHPGGGIPLCLLSARIVSELV
ncbi:MAG: phytoene desaturase [Bacteroidetes bacterium]|nr:MAG: phytoene desaturase [Bacteroidota bacterium]